uniref:ATP-dependent zinc metalloprotease FtsH n=1 Tax=Plagiogramma staurophorum TaxID=1003089 RepID=A0A2U9NMJ5_9STRA|nr:putative plastid division protein [Plagiogramma staurophorum]YP_009495918.1 putative plastid division protein [Plagiogramma staurophorum]AWT38300.1 putative plastid division protein [Plagiogramma staurophorum]AWT38357.1 putative plastid division protein [Plagiogramma staurophorum]
MNQNTLQKVLLGLFFLACIFIGIKKIDGATLINTKTSTNNSELSVNVSSSRMTYGRFLEYLEMGWVKQVDLYDNSRNAIVQASSPELGNRPQAIRVEIPVGSSQLIQKLKEYNIDFDAHPVGQKNIFITIASNLLLPLIFIGSLIFFFQNSENFSSSSGSSPMNLGNSPARYDQSPDTGVSFKDIAGIDEAKAEFEEIVSFLKEPDKYTLVGAKIPKGVLLVGPPGTGKTLLAKAIANEANVPFYSVAGSEFVEMFIGIGAARIRDLFNKASENTPCIVFIDEIDAVGRERGAGIGGGNDEREQTLNQLLTEMDGFKENKGVIVVGATNRADILDAALLRPGRFDRQITVGLPDRLGRIGILKVHARNKPLEDDVSLVKLANRTPGFSGADLANLLNEAAILATRYKKKTISKNEVNEAADRIIGGIAGTTMEDKKNKKLIAYHEVGHAIVGSVLRNHDEVEKITLIPRGGAKGLTWFTPDEDQSLLSRSQLLARIITTLGGRVAEQVVFGDPEVTTGASNDLQQVTNIARQMVTRYGMSNIGPIALEDDNNEQTFVSIPTGTDSDYTETIADRIDNEVCKIINHCEKKATEIILDNRVVIDLIVEKLLDSETLDGDEFRELVKEYTIIPTKI